MYKMMIILQRPAATAFDHFRQEIGCLLTDYQHLFTRIGFAVRDEDVSAASALAITNSQHPKDAVLSLWREEFTGLDAFLAAISNIAASWQKYLVLEIQPLQVARTVGRVPGMCQLAFLQQPQRLPRQQWLDIWLKSHTQVALATQSTFSYRQNIVVIAEPAQAWPLYDAIVEENFPAEAMTDRSVFFNGFSDRELYRQNEKKMVQSCMRFIDFEHFECVPMSEYVIKP